MTLKSQTVAEVVHRALKIRDQKNRRDASQDGYRLILARHLTPVEFWTLTTSRSREARFPVGLAAATKDNVNLTGPFRRSGSRGSMARRHVLVAAQLGAGHAASNTRRETEAGRRGHEARGLVAVAASPYPPVLPPSKLSTTTISAPSASSVSTGSRRFRHAGPPRGVLDAVRKLQHVPATCATPEGYHFSFQPMRISRVLTGQAVKKPTIITICIMNQ